jgi:hypothetical protein
MESVAKMTVKMEGDGAQQPRPSVIKIEGQSKVFPKAAEATLNVRYCSRFISIAATYLFYVTLPWVVPKIFMPIFQISPIFL